MNKQTRFEYLRKTEERPLTQTDLFVIGVFEKGSHPELSDTEIGEAEKILRDKHIAPSDLAFYYWNPYSGRKAWNQRCKSITKVLTAAQWDLLERYFRGLVTSDEGEVCSENV